MEFWMVPIAAMLIVAGPVFLRWFVGALHGESVVRPIGSIAARTHFAEFAPSEIGRSWCADGGKTHLFVGADESWLGVVIATSRDPVVRAFAIDSIKARSSMKAVATIEFQFRDLGWSPLRLQLGSEQASSELLCMFPPDPEAGNGLSKSDLRAEVKI